MNKRFGTIKEFGERGLLVELETDDPIESGLAASAIADKLRQVEGVSDAVAGIASVVIRFDPGRSDREAAERLLEESLRIPSAPEAGTYGDTIEIPVSYGGDFGPDLASLSAELGLAQNKIVEMHSAQIYRAAAIGFAPGFAYLGPLDKALKAPRLETPRAHVPAGSVGIADGFTCIYPLPSPGGWRIIGRTPAALFDSSADDPFVVKPGAAIRFKPISESAFEAASSP